MPDPTPSADPSKSSTTPEPAASSTEGEPAAGDPADIVKGETFGQYYYAHDCGIPYERSDHWLRFFDGIADRIVQELHPTTVLDAGCAIGMLVEQLRRRGVEASGVDISEYAVQQMPDHVREHCWVGSLTEPLPRRYDLVTCIEVVEHMPAADSRRAVANLCEAADRVLLSSSPHDYSEPTHLNVQPSEHWSALMAANGFVRDLDFDASWLTPWAALYVRGGAGTEGIVRTYDRAWLQLRQQVQEVRTKVLELQDELERAQDGRGGPDVEQLQKEILRLRDLVIGKEAELGTALGRVAELEAAMHRYATMEQHYQAVINSRSWRLMWAAATPLRKLRRPS